MGLLEHNHSDPSFLTSGRKETIMRCEGERRGETHISLSLTTLSLPYVFSPVLPVCRLSPSHTLSVKTFDFWAVLGKNFWNQKLLAQNVLTGKRGQNFWFPFCFCDPTNNDSSIASQNFICIVLLLYWLIPPVSHRIELLFSLYHEIYCLFIASLWGNVRQYPMRR